MSTTFAQALQARFPLMTLGAEHLSAPIDDSLLHSLATSHDLTLAETTEMVEDMLAFCEDATATIVAAA